MEYLQLPCGTILRHLFIHLTTVVPFANGGRVARCSEYSRKGNFLLCFFSVIYLVYWVDQRKGLALKGLVPDKVESSSEGVGIGSAGVVLQPEGLGELNNARCEGVCDLLINSSVMFFILSKLL